VQPMKKLILLLSAFASQALSQDLPKGALPAATIEGCWRNVENDRSPGKQPLLCFGAEDVMTDFWTPSGGLDYSVERWVLLSDSTMQIGDKTCKYALHGNSLSISDCSFRGFFEKH